MSKAWVTGAKGFIGRHLTRRLAANGVTVYGLGHGAWPDEKARDNGVSYWVNGEVSATNLQHLLQRGGAPDTIFHLAGGSSVGFSLQFPQEDFNRTVTSAAELLEWVRNFAPDTKIVTASSAAIYGNALTETLDEADNKTPFSPYGFHKRLAELLCESYAANFGMKVSVVRLFSIFGPGLQKQLLWDLCNKLKDNPAQLTMQGTGHEVRDWLHVSEAARILEAAGNASPKGFSVINGGTGHGTSVRDIVELVRKAWGSSVDVTFSGVSRAGDPQRLVADTRRLWEIAGPLQPGDLQKEVSDYVKWFKGQLI
jgi:UDP-glucose 4-epimerase